MRYHHRSQLSPRDGFTLVELIVAIAIMAALAALAVLIFPRLQDSQQVAKGAEQVQGTLFIARQMAMRDQLPRGVRLVVSLDQADNVYRVHQLQYIEQPDYYAPPTGALIGMPDPVNQPKTFLFGGIVNGVAMLNSPPPGTIYTDFYGGNGPGSSQPVLPLDYLDLMGNNKPDGLYKITGVQPSINPATPTVSDTITVLNVPPSTLSLLVQPPPLPPPLYPNFVPFRNPLPFRILRGPRPMVGQQPINLPSDVVVDIPAYANMPHPAGGGSSLTIDGQTLQYDIMFSPSGKVIRDAGNNGQVILWVWNSVAFNNPGGNPVAQDQALVVIYTRTGMIATQPVNIGGLDPYYFIRDGRASGM